MMSLLDKVKTVIEYARFGVFQCKLRNDETGELFFPRAIDRYTEGQNGWQRWATKISGYVKTFGAASCMSLATQCETIDLPLCNNVLTYSWVSGANNVLKVCKLPSLRRVDGAVWQNFTALEYLELGSVGYLHNNALKGCTALKEVYTKEGTTATMHLYHIEELTAESMLAIAESYADMTGLVAPTLYLGEANLNRLFTTYPYAEAILVAKNIEYK